MYPTGPHLWSQPLGSESEVCDSSRLRVSLWCEVEQKINDYPVGCDNYEYSVRSKQVKVMRTPFNLCEPHAICVPKRKATLYMYNVANKDSEN